MNLHEYLASHQRSFTPARRWGLIQLAAEDFGEVEAPVDWQALVQERVDAIRAAVAQAQVDRCDYDSDVLAYKSSMVSIMDFDIGPIDDLAREIGELLPDPKVPPSPPPTPPPPPSPTPPPVPPPSLSLSGVYGTYSGHGLAVDLYGGRTDDEVRWGPHHGLPIVAPCDGRVEVYSFGTPLDTATFLNHGEGTEWSAYVYNWKALNEGWTCWAADPLQTMFVAVFWPTPLLTVEGYRIGHLHYGHVRSDITAGAVVKGQQFATVWDSGVRFEPSVPNARAAHTHCCAGIGATLSPNGDLPGHLAAVVQGWAVTSIGKVPGPTDYLSGLYTAGRLTRDFTENRKPIPPMPA